MQVVRSMFIIVAVAAVALSLPSASIAAPTEWRNEQPVTVKNGHTGPILNAGQYWDTLEPFTETTRTKSTKPGKKFGLKGAVDRLGRVSIIIICEVSANAPSLGGGGVWATAGVWCSQTVDQAKNRVCVQVYNQNTGAIATDNTTCKPSADPSVITGCANCIGTSKLSYATSYCFGHFSYRGYTYGWASKVGYGSDGAQDSSLWVDLC